MDADDERSNSFLSLVLSTPDKKLLHDFKIDQDREDFLEWPFKCRDCRRKNPEDSDLNLI